MDKKQSFLELKIVWKDDDMFELEVHGSNRYFSGITKVYDTSDSLEAFAKSLFGYPASGNKTLIHKAGIKDGYSYFEMSFYCIDKLGHIGVLIRLEKIVSTSYRVEEKSKVKLEIIVLPSCIDRFQKQLLQLAITQEGTATLYGQDTPNDS